MPRAETLLRSIGRESPAAYPWFVDVRWVGLARPAAAGVCVAHPPFSLSGRLAIERWDRKVKVVPQGPPGNDPSVP